MSTARETSPRMSAESKSTNSRSELESKIMKNPVVMGKIAEALPAKNLFTLRLTCRMWNEIFITDLKKKHSPIKLMERGCSCCQKGINPRLKHFTESIQMGQNQNLPFTRYDIELHGRSQRSQAKQIQNFQDFITTFGGTITRLCLMWEFCDNFSPDALRKMVFEQTPALSHLILWPSGRNEKSEKREQLLVRQIPNLKKLKVGSDYGYDQRFIRLIADIVEHASHLKSVKVSGGACDDLVLPIFTQIRGSLIDLSKLKTLKLSDVRVSGLKLLVELGQQSEKELRLESFATTVYCYSSVSGQAADDDDNNNYRVDLPEASVHLHAFLKTQTSTLRKLYIGFSIYNHGRLETRPETPFRLPRMEELCTLELGRNGFELFGLQYDGTSFIDTFPKLYRFVYYYETTIDCHEENFEEDVSQISHSGVKDLSLFVRTQARVDRFASLFPSVTQLEIRFHEEELELDRCWNLWPSLVKLNNSLRPPPPATEAPHSST